MKSILVIVLSAVVFISCKEDETVTCTLCNSPETLSFEVCRESDGNASVNGEDTGTNYEVYLQGLIDAGANCGG